MSGSQLPTKGSAGLYPQANEAVKNVLGALSGVIGMEIIELWVNTADRFSLHHVFKGELSMIVHQTSDPTYARFLAKKALSSKEMFYWGANRTDRLHPSSPYHTAMAFRFPRDNIGTDLYILGYSSDYIKFAQSKLDFIYWIGHAVSVAAFSVSLYNKTGDPTSAITSARSADRLHDLVLDLSQLGSNAGSTKSQGNLSVPVTSSRVLTLAMSTKAPENAFSFSKHTSEKSSTIHTNESSDELDASAGIHSPMFGEKVDDLEVEKNFKVDATILYSSSSDGNDVDDNDEPSDDDDETLKYPDDVNVVGVLRSPAHPKFETYKQSLKSSQRGSSQKSLPDVSPLVSSRSEIGS